MRELIARAVQPGVAYFEMIDLTGKVVDECGWAGPLLWVVTRDDYSIHLYDGRIRLNGTLLKARDDVNGTLSGKTIEKIEANKIRFRILTSAGNELEVEHRDIETARVFKRNDDSPHWVYRDGTLSQDQDD